MDSPGKLFDGRAFAREKLARVTRFANQWQADHRRAPCIVSIFSPDDPASVLYTRLKKQDAESCGMEYRAKAISFREPRTTWIREVQRANADTGVEGLLVQKPSQAEYCAETGKSASEFQSWWHGIAESLAVEKDIDGLSPLGLFALERRAEMTIAGQRPTENSLDHFVLPATAQAVIDIALHAAGGVEELRKKSVAIIGRSVIVGRPAAYGLQLLGVSVQLLSSQDTLANALPRADVVITATGKPLWIEADWLKQDAILIDVGAPKPEFQTNCYEKSSFYTPVPYGVGPVTRACLLENLAKLPC